MSKGNNHIVWWFLFLVLIFSLFGCGEDSTDNNEINCPAGRHPLGNRCVCDSGIEVNGECVVPADGDLESEELVDDFSDLDRVDSDIDENYADYEDSEVSVEVDEEAAVEIEEESYPIYDFPSPRVLFDDSPVVDAKLVSDGDIILFATYFDNSSNPNRYDLMSIRSRGGSPVFIGNVTWDPDVYSWLSFYITPDDRHVIFSNNLNGMYIIIISSVEQSTPQILPDSCYPAHVAVSDDGMFLAFGTGMPDQNGGLLPSLYLMPLESSLPAKLVATQVVPESFAFEHGTHNLVYGQHTQANLFNVVITNYDQNFMNVVAEDVVHPYFKLTDSPSGMVYYKKRGYQGLFLDLRFVEFGSLQESSIEIINWESNKFMPNDIMLAMNDYMVVFVGPYDDGWMYFGSSITGGAVYELSYSRKRNAVLSNATSQYLFIPTYSENGKKELELVDLTSMDSTKVCTFLLYDNIITSHDGRYAFFTATLPDVYPQAGTKVIVAFDTNTQKSYVVACNPDGKVLLVSNDNRKLFYTDTSGALVSVDLNFDSSLILKIPNEDDNE